MYINSVIYCVLFLLIIPPVMAGSPSANTTDLELRIQKLENTLSGAGLLDLFQQVESLKRKVSELQGEIEEQNHKLNKLQKKNDRAYSDLNSRLQSAETQIQLLANTNQTEELSEAADPAITESTDDTITETESAPETLESEPTEQPQTPENEAQAKEAYQAAFMLLKDSQYDDASTAFTQFINNYPESRYADRAHYWLGESYFVQRNFDLAITAYHDLISNFPDSRKLAHGTLKLAYSYEELQRIDEAKQTLESVITLYPGTSAADDATSRLRSLTTDEPEVE